jgi:hypothetical protein
MKERRKKERRRWGRKVTYPFIDSDGVLVTKNRRRKVDRRELPPEEETENKEEVTPAPVVAEKSTTNTSLDISESKVMELEEALQDDSSSSSNIVASIKDLEEEIMDATNIEAASSHKLDTGTKKRPSENEIKIVHKSASKQAEPLSIQKEEIPELVPITNHENNKHSIELSLKGKKHIFTENEKPCQVGRDPNCDIVVQGKFVSRAHAKIIYKNGKFLLEDNSFNGTYIKFDTGQKIHVSNDEQTLMANGVMSMGKPVDDDSRSVISFKINQ